MSNDIYTTYNIDKSKLKRDYIKNPLYIAKNGIGSERPYKEDLEYLYIELNIRQSLLFEYFNVKHSTFSNWIKYFNIKKDSKHIIENTSNTILTKYGVNTYTKTKEYKNKIIDQNIKLYGVNYFTQTDLFKNKSKQTCLKNMEKNIFLKQKNIKIK